MSARSSSEPSCRTQHVFFCLPDSLFSSLTSCFLSGPLQCRQKLCGPQSKKVVKQQINKKKNPRCFPPRDTKPLHRTPALRRVVSSSGNFLSLNTSSRPLGSASASERPPIAHLPRLRNLPAPPVPGTQRLALHIQPAAVGTDGAV